MSEVFPIVPLANTNEEAPSLVPPAIKNERDWSLTPFDKSKLVVADPIQSRIEKVGIVVSARMQKTIVVEIEMRKSHPKYKRVIKSNKKFYAHDEQNSARVGDVVRIRESRPLSKLKRWSLEDIVRRSTLGVASPMSPKGV